MDVDGRGPAAGAGGSSGAAGPPAGAVVVPVEEEGAAAAAAGAAAPAPAAARLASTTRVRTRVRWAARPAWTRLSARLAWAAALFILGCAAAGLACFAMTSLLPPPAADSHRRLRRCARTIAEAAGLRAESEQLLLAGAAQVLAATMGLLVPAARPIAVFGCLMSWLTAYRATAVLWMLVGCHDGGVVFHYCVFYVVLCAALGVGAVVSIR